MSHGGDIYSNAVDIDFSVSLNPARRCRADEEAVREAILAGIREAGNYPDIEQRQVRSAIAEAEGIGADNVIAGSGASELIMALTNMISPKKVLVIEPGYIGYRHALLSVPGCKVVSYVLQEEKSFCPDEDILDKITEDIDMIIIQDPINPTGVNLEYTLMDAILEKADKCYITVMYDRSFFKLSGRYFSSATDPDRKCMSTKELIERYDSLYIISSYTKSFALPGIRMGYVMSTERNISQLKSHLPEWNISAVAASVMKACASIDAAGDYMKQSLSFIAAEREYITASLRQMGLKVFDSDTVFILFKDPYDCDIYEKLLEKRILIRKCGDIKGLTEVFYRIGIRSRKDNEKLIYETGKIVNGRKTS